MGILACVKVCSRCKTPKDESDFYADKTRKDGLYPQCRSCASSAKKASRQRGAPGERAAIKRWREENQDRVRLHDRRAKFKQKYGITIEQYEAMLEEQGGVCAICKGAQPNGVRLCVDHCHDTKRVRGLLCVHCNTGIGHFKHDKNLLREAINYL